MLRFKESTLDFRCHGGRSGCQRDHEAVVTNSCQRVSESVPQPEHPIISEIARCFLRLANIDNGAFERLGRYQTALWRQVCQILLTLDSLRRQKSKRARTFQTDGLQAALFPMMQFLGREAVRAIVQTISRFWQNEPKIRQQYQRGRPQKLSPELSSR